MNNKFKIAIIGSRKYNNYYKIEKEFFKLLDDLKLIKEDILIVSGGAKGVDSIAQQIARNHGIPILIFYPDYIKYGKRAPLVRNLQIIENSDFILAFPTKDSKGTRFTITEARKRKKPNRIIKVDKSQNCW